jgi:hypothetical protein
MAIFISMEDWICGPKALTDIQGLIWFTGGSGTEEGAEVGLCGHGTKLFFFPSVKRFVKGGLETSISVHRWLQQGNLGGGSFIKNFERQVIIWSSFTRDSMRCVKPWRLEGPPFLGTLRDR